MQGVGVHIANALHQKYSFQPEITIIDGGTTGNDLLPYFEQHDTVLIIDAVEFDESPGFMGLIEDDGYPVPTQHKTVSASSGLIRCSQFNEIAWH